MTNEETILTNWIDNATYSQLLERWRHAPSRDHMFEGNVGGIYSLRFPRFVTFRGFSPGEKL